MHLCEAQVLHLLHHLRRVRCELIVEVSQHDVLDVELTHRLQGDLLQVHLTTFHLQQPDVPAYTCIHVQALSQYRYPSDISMLWMMHTF